MKQEDRSVLVFHPNDHKDLWCRESEWCPGASFGLVFEVSSPRMKRGHLLAVHMIPDTSHTNRQ